MTKKIFIRRLLIFAGIAVLMLSGYRLKETLIEQSPAITPSFYRDAEAIYRYYFSEFNLSTPAKEQIMTELEMIVNAIALEEAQGKDIKTMLLFSNQIAQQKISTKAIRSEIGHFDDFIQAGEGRKKAEYNVPEGNFSLFHPDEYNGSCTSFVNYIQRQTSLVKTHPLPYYIPNSALQMIDIRENRFLKVDDEKPEKEYDTDRYSDREKARMLAHLNQFRWQSADIVLGHTMTDTQAHSIQGYWNHAGIYNSECNCIIDVWPSDENGFSGGVRQSSIAFWANHFSDIAVLRLSDISTATKKTIETHAAARVGERYNLSTHRMNPDGGWYCSKLVYYVYLQEGINLDIGGGVTVLPDDIAISRGVEQLGCLKESVQLP